MKETSESWARKVRARSIVAVACSVLSCIALTKGAFADCPSEPTTYENGVIEGLVATGDAEINSSLGMDGQGRFLIAWRSTQIGSWPHLYNRLLVQRFVADGDCLCETGDQCPACLSVEEDSVAHALPSVAMSAGAYASVRWLGHRMSVSETGRMGVNS